MKQLIFLAAFTLVAIAKISAQAVPAPHLEQRGKATQLIVGGQPFLVLGGELYNSSSSSIPFLDELWAPLKKMNLNTVLAAVAWEQLEPQEGKYDFTVVDGIIKGAKSNKMKVVLLWFGSWKNGLSHYAPLWVKSDIKRFPRILLENGKSTETISATSEEAARADAKAFGAMMKHVKEVDASDQTVIMVQVENEVGIIGGIRDHSSIANDLFAKPVPKILMDGIVKFKAELQPAFKTLWQSAGSKTSGNWTEVFGNGPAADEAFMAWHYASYINRVAEAGKSQYNLPMFINAWIVQPNDKKPGDYPSGGPQAHVHDIYRIGAPSIDIKSPDVYLPGFKDVAALYHHPWNPLFIPESFAGIDGASNAFYSIGKFNGIGYSPFGIDRKVDTPSNTPIAKAYFLLGQLTPAILAAQAAGNISGMSLSFPDSIRSFELGGYKITVTLRKNWNGVIQAPKGYCIIMHTSPNEFTIAGSNVDVTFIPATPGPSMSGIASVWEGTYNNSMWIPGRLLNGDDIMMSYNLAEEAMENRTGTGARLLEEPSIVKVLLYRF